MLARVPMHTRPSPTSARGLAKFNSLRSIELAYGASFLACARATRSRACLRLRGL